MNIQKMLLSKALEKRRKILLVEGEDERVIKAAAKAAKEKIAVPVLLGSKATIEKIAKKEKINLEGIEIHDYIADPKFNDYAAHLFELRKSKGMTIEEAGKLLKNPNYFAAMMLGLGLVDGAVGGCKYSTADWMRPVFQVVGKGQGKELVSAICFIEIKDKIFFLSDTDFNIVPNEKELAEIALNAAEFVEGLGIKPKVALLSYSSHGSGEHPSLEQIRTALKIAKEKNPKLLIDGELQLDAAVNPDSAKKKCPDSVLKGDANVLVFPSITVGNVLIHGLYQWTDYKLHGSFPIGLAKPVINGGRSFGPDEIYDCIIACAMECNLK